MTVCNACRYCEQYCPVFPAMEQRADVRSADLIYLANLCHNCGECLYACQYAPPHEFGINVPRTLAEIRLALVRGLRLAAAAGAAFRRTRRRHGACLVAAFTALLLLPGGADRRGGALWRAGRAAISTPSCRTP